MFTLITLLRMRYHEYINSDSRSPIRIFFKLLNEFAPWHPIRLTKNVFLLTFSLAFAIVYFICSLLAKGLAALVLAGIRKILSLFSSNDPAEASDTIPVIDSEEYEDDEENVDENTDS